MDMPARKPDGTIVPDSGPLGDECKLRGGVSLRRKGGECDAAILLRALPGELLRNGVSKAGGYLAYCWTTMVLLPAASAGCGSGDLKGASISFLFCFVGSIYQGERISLGSRFSDCDKSSFLIQTNTNPWTCTRRPGQSHFITIIKAEAQKDQPDSENATGVIASTETGDATSWTKEEKSFQPPLGRP